MQIVCLRRLSTGLAQTDYWGVFKEYCGHVVTSAHALMSVDLVDMALAQLGEKVSDERAARTKFLVKELMCALPEILDVPDIALMEEREARRDDKALQLAYLMDHLPGMSRKWPASFSGLVPCERCCMATDNICPCGIQVRNRCCVCETLKFRCINCPGPYVCLNLGRLWMEAL